MAEIHDHVDELGTGDVPHGTVAGIRIPSGSVEHLVYDADQEAWLGRQHWTMRVYQNDGIRAEGADATWKYPGQFPESPATRVLPTTAHQFQIHKILHAGELWDAGLRLQEHLAGEFKPKVTLPGAVSGAELPEVALAWYPLASGDDFLSPDSFNHGVRLAVGEPYTDYIARQWSSGWQNTVLTVEPEPNEHLYPEIYMRGPTVNLRQFSARHRWVAGDVGGAGSGEDTGYRPSATLVGWYQAGQVYVADSQPVAEWGDWSGYGIALMQSDSAKRPTKMHDGAIPFVRFDGSNDVMRTRPMTNVPGGGPQYGFAPPVTVYMVMRQRATGGSIQVWLGQRGSGAPLIYRGDSTDQVNYWSGGSDAIYHRSSAWPTPWMVWSSTLTSGGALSIWEGTTSVFSGSAGTGGFSGFCVGNNDGEAYPAALDLAELIYCSGVPTTPERTAVVNYLEDKYGL